MERIKRYIGTACMSFTLVVMLESLLFILGMAKEFSAKDIFGVFAICAIISLLMFLVEAKLDEHFFLMILIHLIIVTAVIIVFVFFILKMIPVTVMGILLLLGMGVLVYFVILFFVVFKDKSDAEKINKKINKKFSLKGKGKNNE